MPERLSRRSHSLRRRPASSAGSSDAPSTAAPTVPNVSASYYSPLAGSSTDRQHQAKEDAGKKEAETVVGGKVDGAVSSSTDSGVRVGLSVHGGHVPVGPTVRSVSDTASTSTRLTRSRTQSLPRYVRETILVEQLCTLQACSHCCKCHLRHDNNGYGRCMRSANVPWPDCECKGKCTAGRCAQVECDSNRVVIDLTATNSVSDSQSTITLRATQSQQQPHHDPHSNGVSVVSHPSTLPSPLPGVRREAGGVHDGEEVCVGPQADTHASSSAAYRQPSTTVTDTVSGSGLVADTSTSVDATYCQPSAAVSDSWIAASSVARLDGVEEAAHTASDGDSINSVNTGTGAGVPVGHALPQAVLDQLPSLPHQPRRLPVIADGRCAVASVLLARGVIPDSHNTRVAKRTIDSARRRLGTSLATKWTEADWIRRVPLHLRRDRQECGPSNGKQLRRSYSVYQQLLSRGKATEWLDHAVFHVASEEYNIGLLIIYNAGFNTHTAWYCARVGAGRPRHAVLFQHRGHYECVEYDGLRLFPSDHTLVVKLEVMAAAHPVQLPEDDPELAALEALPSSAIVVSPPAKRAFSRARQLTSLTVSRKLDVHDRVDAAGGQVRPTGAHGVRGVERLPPTCARVAVHGPLYERVTFHNQQQWLCANEPLWNAYRVASMAGQRSQLTAILLDILLLPQRVLPKLRRSGRAAKRRTAAAAGRRFRAESERVRERYGCPEPDQEDEQRMQLSTTTLDETAARTAHPPPVRAASIAARELAALQVADTTDADSGSGSDVRAGEGEDAATDSDNEDATHSQPSAGRRVQRRSNNPDRKAAQRAAYLMQCGLTRKAAQVLHSATQMTDLRTEDAQSDMVRLHPQLPPGTVLPPLPENTPPTVLEDDEDMRKLLGRTDNGTAAGPSGWGGNMLALLARSSVCRLGVTALLRDIINGALDDDARQLLLASRLVALTKPGGGHRPIAVGEMFYRLAAIVAVRRVSGKAAELLSPHQYGIGVPGGAEKIVHSLQQELTDKDKRAAMLQLDISNAFNSCDRARLLSELYELPDLQSVYRIAHFAYTQPSVLVLGGCDGAMIRSAQGVRQGDPLSALLFCVYMQKVLQRVSDATGVTVYGYFDDISVTGTPQQVMAALSYLRHSLPAASLQLNTAKSHFTYFHDYLTPLTADMLSTLSANNIQLHHDWVGAVGVVVGRDDAAIRAGMRSVLDAAGDYDPFLRRILLDDMPIHTALQLLRVSLVPAMNYFLRCIAPVCIEDEAQRFDQRVLEAAASKLGVSDEMGGDERGDSPAELLQRKLSDGGFALVPAVRTSSAAFLGSLAACHAQPAFAPYCEEGASIPDSSMLHRWIDDSMQRVRRAAVGDQYQLDIEKHMPATAGRFFCFHADNDPSATAKLQQSLSAMAAKHNSEAATEQMKELSKQGNKRLLAHHRAITAKGAWNWKVVRPEDPHMRLSDVECAIAARLNLGLPPFNAQAMARLPEHCPLCVHSITKQLVSLRDEPWHFLTCKRLMGEQIRRHNAVVDAIARTARLVGGQAVQEVKGLEPHTRQRPDLQLAFPGRMILTDVVVSHALTTGRVNSGQNGTASKQAEKAKKYAHIASRLGAELLNVSMDTSGGLASEAVELVRAIGDEGEKWSAGAWSSARIERQLLGAIAVAVQRGNALIMLTGYTRASVVRE